MSGWTNSCRAFFEEQRSNPGKVVELLDHPEAEIWESLAASEFSPGPVASEEAVLRKCFNPIHFEVETGELRPSAFADIKARGGSVDRPSHTTREAVIEEGRASAKAKNAESTDKELRSLRALVRLPVAELRAMTSQNKRLYAVYDTALQLNKAHADICLIAGGGQAARSARLQIMDLANKGLEPI